MLVAFNYFITNSKKIVFQQATNQMTEDIRQALA
jgi:hypothetical protein